MISDPQHIEMAGKSRSIIPGSQGQSQGQILLSNTLIGLLHRVVALMMVDAPQTPPQLFTIKNSEGK